MELVCTLDPFPTKTRKTIFLAGPTPRSTDVESWRPEALKYLADAGFDGHVFVPEFAGEPPKRFSQADVIDWETEALHRADCILFWVPRKMDTLPALTTNIEFGEWWRSGKIVFGAPPDAEHVRYLHYKAKRGNVPRGADLHETVLLAVEMVSAGAPREDGECQVPLHVWRTDSFQTWYQAQKAAGNRLDGGRVEYTFRVGPNRDRVFLWAFHANIFIAAENRTKTNEVVMGRPEISVVLAFRRAELRKNWMVLLIREFRSSAATSTGRILELPGGSVAGLAGAVAARAVAAVEFTEETGIPVAADELTPCRVRQVSGTLASYKAHLFALELDDQRCARAKELEGVPRGDEQGTGELTAIRLVDLQSIALSENIDWATQGMILSVLSDVAD